MVMYVHALVYSMIVVIMHGEWNNRVPIVKLEAVNEPVHLPLQASSRLPDSFKTFLTVHPPDDVSFAEVKTHSLLVYCVHDSKSVLAFAWPLYVCLWPQNGLLVNFILFFHLTFCSLSQLHSTCN